MTLAGPLKEQKLKAEVTPSAIQMDPGLQHLLEHHRRGFVPAPTSSSEAGEIAVIAHVQDQEAWSRLRGVRHLSTLAKDPSGGWLVTGRLQMRHLTEIRRAPGVLSLKAGQRLRPTILPQVTQALEADPTQFPTDAQGATRQGVLVGIIDYGCDFAHPNFRTPEGNTRLLGIWDQGAPRTAGQTVPYGRFYDESAINKALQAADPYAALTYQPNLQRRTWRDGTHGTHVMDIAAGNGRGTNTTSPNGTLNHTEGVAPQASLVFVEIAPDTPWEGEEVVDSNFGDSIHLLEAVRFIFDLAEKKNLPCVINISLGTNGGAHDGSSPVERAIDAMTAERPDRCVVIAASNSCGDRTHAQGKVEAGKFVDLTWLIEAGDPTPNEVEVWYDGGDAFELEILAPGLQSVLRLPLRQEGRLRDEANRLVVFAVHRQGEPNNKLNHIGIYLETLAPPGDWTIRLHGVPGQVTNGIFHAWIERDDMGPSTFGSLVSEDCTLGSIACGQKSVVVGSYDPFKGNAISSFSSSGPTRDGRPKPEVSAPGDHIEAARSGIPNALVSKSGTSMAAPAVTGVVALMLAEARARGTPLPIDVLRDLLLRACRSETGTWHPRFGYGRLSARLALEAVIQYCSNRPPGGPPAAAQPPAA